MANQTCRVGAGAGPGPQVGAQLEVAAQENVEGAVRMQTRARQGQLRACAAAGRSERKSFTTDCDDLMSFPAVSTAVVAVYEHAAS